MPQCRIPTLKWVTPLYGIALFSAGQPLLMGEFWDGWTPDCELVWFVTSAARGRWGLLCAREGASMDAGVFWAKEKSWGNKTVVR